jgi:beta-glucosidase/6-phospho-beta-glucosidase/beta-galactosidase
MHALLCVNELLDPLLKLIKKQFEASTYIKYSYESLQDELAAITDTFAVPTRATVGQTE